MFKGTLKQSKHTKIFAVGQKACTQSIINGRLEQSNVSIEAIVHKAAKI